MLPILRRRKKLYTLPSVGFNENNTVITISDNALIQNLHDAEMTVEMLVYLDIGDHTNEFMISKQDQTNQDNGWRLYITSANRLQVYIECLTVDASSITASQTLIPGSVHHIGFYYNDAGDRKPYLFVDGIWNNLSQTAGVDAIDSDIGETLLMGRRNDPGNTLNGAIIWAAISNNDRYSHVTNFTAPTEVPTQDVNHVEIWALDEGSGTTATATINTPTLDGTIANGTWEYTPV